jgi:hypothetical protein
MKIEKLQEKIKTKKEELDALEKELKTEQLKSETEVSEWVKIPGTEYEVTKNVLYKGKTYNEIMLLKKPEEELLTLKLIGAICENPELVKELKMDSSSTKDDFFIQQPFDLNRKNGYVARFYADSGYASLYCGEVADYSYSSLGVRFAKKILKKK